MKKYILLTVSIQLLLTYVSFSQDYHYWSEQFGANSTLLGGSVIAGGNDNSSVYYNPASLGFIHESSISVDATIYKAQSTKIKNAIGSGEDVNYNRYAYYPQMLSGMLNFVKNDKIKLGYVLMTRFNDRLRLNSRVEKQADVIDEIQGEEYYIGAFEYYKSIADQWGGLGVEYRLNDQLSLGATVFVSYRYQEYRQSIYARAIPVQDTSYYLASINSLEDLVFYNWKAFVKIGLAYKVNEWDLGLTITSPSINILGDNDVQREISFSNINDFVEPDVMLDFLAIDRQESLPTHYKMPWAFGLGAKYSFGKTALSLSAEYFARIETYDMSPAYNKPVVYPPTIYTEELIGEIDFLSVKGWAEPVFNVALGWEQKLNEPFTLLMGFRTNFNNFKEDKSTDDIAMWGRTWDLYHLSGGVTYGKNNNEVIVGLDCLFGYQKNVPQFVNFDGAKDYLGLVGETNNSAVASDWGIALVVGFTHRFSDEE